MASGKQSLKKDTTYVYVGHFLRYLSPLILVPYYSRVLGPDGYGQVLAAMALMTMVSVVVNFGFFFSGIRELAATKDRIERSQILGRQIIARLLLLPIAIIVGVIGTIYSPVLMIDPWFGTLATALGVVLGFGFSWFFQGIRQFKTSIILESLAYPLNIILVLLLVSGQGDGIYALIALFISAIISLGVSYIYVRKAAGIIFTGVRAGLEEIKTTTTFFVTSMSFVVLTTGSTYILSTMASVNEVGYYGVAERFVSLAVGLLNPISQVLMPTISNLHKKEPAQAQRLIRKGLLLETTYGVVAPFVGILLAPFAIPLLLGKTFEPAVVIFQVMLCTLPFTAVKHALVLYLLIPMKKENIYLLTSVSNLVVNIGIALVAVPIWGAMGMVTARVSAEIFATFLMVTILWRMGLLNKLLSRSQKCPDQGL